MSGELVLISIFLLVGAVLMAVISRAGRLVFLGIGAVLALAGLFVMQMNGPHDPGPFLVAGAGLLLIIAAVSGEFVALVWRAASRGREANHGR